MVESLHLAGENGVERQFICFEFGAYHHQISYTSTTELLFALSTIYHLRVIERLWGSRKYGVGYASTPRNKPYKIFV